MDRLDKQLAETRSLLAQAERLARLGVWDWDIINNTVVWSEGTHALYGSQPGELSLADVMRRVHPDDRAALAQATDRALSGAGHFQIKHRLVRPDGQTIDVRAIADAEFDADGKPVRLVGVMQEITELVATQRREEYRLTHDELTDTYNRAGLLDEINHRLTRADIQSFMLVRMFLPRLEEIAFGYGLEAVLDVLRQVVDRFRSNLPGVVIAHVGDDQLEMIVDDPRLLRDRNNVTAAIRHIFDEQFDLPGGLLMYLDTHCGIAIFPGHGREPVQLIRNAYRAMRTASERGLQVLTFESGRDGTNSDIELLNDLRSAIGTDQMGIHYQPLVNPDGMPHGAEALLRWRHPVRGTVTPATFVPLAERGGLLTSMIDPWLFQGICRDHFTWTQRGIHVPIAVNLSARAFLDSELPRRLTEVLTTWGGNSGDLELEITETAVLADADHAIRVARSLERAGFTLAIDDFGTGYSPLWMLQKMPVSKIKIDHSFVSEMATNQTSYELVAGMIRMAHSVGSTVVAEGVEDAQTFNLLRELNCDSFQGFFFSRALPAVDAADWITSRSE